MFEVVEIGPITKKRWFRPRLRTIKLKAISSSEFEKLARHGNWSVQKYRAEFTEGDVITVGLSDAPILVIGDHISVHSLAAQGSIEHFFRLVKA